LNSLLGFIVEWGFGFCLYIILMECLRLFNDWNLKSFYDNMLPTRKHLFLSNYSTTYFSNAIIYIRSLQNNAIRTMLVASYKTTNYPTSTEFIPAVASTELEHIKIILRTPIDSRNHRGTISSWLACRLLPALESSSLAFGHCE